MNEPARPSIEEVFRAVRDDPALSLNERLERLSACYRAVLPEYPAAVDELVAHLEAGAAGSAAPQVGDAMPDFIMPDQDGRLVRLSDLLAEGPVVLVFHRAHWCPYCRMNLAALAQIQGRIGAAQIVAVSAETQAHTRTMRDEAEADFRLLSDMGAGYTLSLGLAIWLGDAIIAIHRRAGRDIPGDQGGGDWIVPIPAVFVIDRDGTVAVRHVDPDYRRRMELTELLEGLERLQAR